MKKCPHCGMEITDEARFCINCATPIHEPQTVDGTKSSLKMWLLSLRFRFPRLFNAKTLSAIGISVGCTVLAISTISFFIFTAPPGTDLAGGNTISGETDNTPNKDQTPVNTPDFPQDNPEMPENPDTPDASNENQSPINPATPQSPDGDTGETPSQETSSDGTETPSQGSNSSGIQTPSPGNNPSDIQTPSQGGNSSGIQTPSQGGNTSSGTQTPSQGTTPATPSVPLKQIEKEKPYVDLDYLKSGNNLMEGFVSEWNKVADDLGFYDFKITGYEDIEGNKDIEWQTDKTYASKEGKLLDDSYLGQGYDESAYEKTINIERRVITATIHKIHIPATKYIRHSASVTPTLTLDVITPELGHQAVLAKFSFQVSTSHIDTSKYTIFDTYVKLFFINYGVFCGSQKAKQVFTEFENSEEKKYLEDVYMEDVYMEEGIFYLFCDGYHYDEYGGIRLFTREIGASNYLSEDRFSAILHERYKSLWD